MKRFWRIAGLTAVLALAGNAANQTAIEKARAERDRIRALVDSGALPGKALLEAEERLREAADEAVLERTLYGEIDLEELTREQAAEMVAAAERLLARQKERLDRMRRLAEEGAVPPTALEPSAEELARRSRTLELARERAQLLGELLEMAQAEAAVASAREELAEGPRGLLRRFDGPRIPSSTHLEHIRRAFERQFRRPLPVSAHGDTALHRALGFDHSGRVDVALHPDQPEGRWLLALLEELGLPYYAFRSSAPGRSTGAHIHIGPPSTRLRISD